MGSSLFHVFIVISLWHIFPSFSVGHNTTRRITNIPDITAADCEKYSARTVVPTHLQKVPPMLWTFPGSGSGWVRLLIEHATGYLSGSVYGDLSLVPALPGEFLCNKEVSIIKAHPTTHDFSIVERGNLGHRCRIHHFNKAVMVVRNPYDAIWSDHNRKITRSHVGKILEKDFDRKAWFLNANRLARKYKAMWTDSYTPFMRRYPNGYIIVKYEDLIHPEYQLAELKKIMDFMGYDISDKRMQCAFFLANNPTVKRPRHTTDKVMSKSDAYSRSLVCNHIWPLVRESCAKYNYQPYNNMNCNSSARSS
mmetsp:Transcript_1582/g.2527  ORF Transcript_1582/g.2527 Transcript_1582/m.2527 type:complete len:308 (-) Transcript_1582:111-1034(-)